MTASRLIDDSHFLQGTKNSSISLSLYLSSLCPLFSITAKPQLVRAKLRWAQLHCLETTMSIMTAGTPRGLNPWSWCLWLSVWIHTGQIGKTITSYTGCCCLSGQRQYHSCPVSATPSAQCVRPCPHTLTGALVCQHSSFSFSKFLSIGDIFSTLKQVARCWYAMISIHIHYTFMHISNRLQTRTKEEKNAAACRKQSVHFTRFSPLHPLLYLEDHFPWSRPLILFNSIPPSVSVVPCADH